MATDSLRLTALIPASPEAVYAAWLDAELHSKMTGGVATGEGKVGGRFSAWDGYIEGEILELTPGKRILQSWRTTQFPARASASRLEITFEPTRQGTRLTVVHSVIPKGQGRLYRTGWKEHYFDPMQRYFSQPQSATNPKSKPRLAKKSAAKLKPAGQAAPKSKPAKQPASKVAAKPQRPKQPAAKKPAKQS